MERTVVFRSHFLRLYIHKFIRGDGEQYHDHPWKGLFVQLRGSYTEHVLIPHSGIPGPDMGVHIQNSFGRFRSQSTDRRLLQVTYIDQNHIHRVDLDKVYEGEAASTAPLTLAFCGPRRKTAEGDDDWGFWVAVQHDQERGVSMRKRVPWKTFLESKNPNQAAKPSH